MRHDGLDASPATAVAAAAPVAVNDGAAGITVADGGAVLELAPRTGGAIAAFRLDGVDVLRPTPASARDAGDVRAHACYPLVPCSNRIAQARLRYADREYALARNFGDSPHAIHGVGWQRAWTVESSGAASARLAVAHDARGDGSAAWPWSFRAVQTFSVGGRADAATLLARLTIENTGDEPFPFGLGWHPFFVLDPDTTLAFGATHVWVSDPGRIPVARHELRADESFASARALSGADLDHVFDGAGTTGQIRWPGRGLAATIETDSALDRRVVYAPAGKPFFAFEPVSHMTDAFNRAARGEMDTGTRALGPGQAFSCTMRIRVRRSR